MKLKVYVSTDRVGSRVEREIDIDDEDLEGLDDSERQSYLEEIAKEEMFNLFEWGWEEA